MRINSALRGKIYRVLQFIVVSLIIIIPFIKTPNGNNLIRFDANTLHLYFFNGVVEFSNFFIVFIGILLVVFLFIFVTQLLGRIWCGWLCPQSFFALKIEKYAHIIKNKKLRKVGEFFLAALFAFLLTANMTMYFVSPYEYIETFKGPSGGTFTAIFLVMFFFILVDFAFVRYRWCKYVCPYSKFQVVMTDDDTLYVGMIPAQADACINCMACVRVCPTKIDPRKNPDGDCIYCETCVDACNHIFQKKNKDKKAVGVLGYVWGDKDKINLKRPNLIITFLISVVLAVILVVSIINDNPINFKVQSDVQNLGNGRYEVTITQKNNTNRPIKLALKTEGDIATVTPNEVRVHLSQSKTIRYTIQFKDEKSIPSNGELKLFGHYKYNEPPVELTLKLNN